MEWLTWNRAIYALAAFIALPYRWLCYRRAVALWGVDDLADEDRARMWPR